MHKLLIMITWIKPVKAVLLFLLVVLFMSCRQSSHQQMIVLLQQLSKRNHSALNPFHPEVKVAYYDSVINARRGNASLQLISSRASLGLQTGHEQESANTYDSLVKKMG